MKYTFPGIFMSFFRKLKISLLKIYEARGSTHEIAFGSAIGAFWGVFPTFGLGTVFTLLLYKIFRFNLLAAISAAFISNPLTSPFFLMISYKVGGFFIETNIKFQFDNWYHNLSQIGYVLLIGSIIVSLVTSVIVYFIAKYVIEHKRMQEVTVSENGFT
jgi:uncharacterized protein